MEEKKLAFRMYFFVPYNISPIQQAIQAGHAALEYALLNGNSTEFLQFAQYHKTWIILNGGTTNNKLNDEGTDYQGTLNQIKNSIIQFNFTFKKGGFQLIEYADFYEPDLNSALTAVCFLADERVWDYENYIDFYDWLMQVEMDPDTKSLFNMKDPVIRRSTQEQFKAAFPEHYAQWTKEIMGGEKNVFLRNLLRGKKLA